jgi:ATP-binding cassette subfamily B multidrug efflux pump
MFALFERWLKPTATPTHPEPPPGLMAFYWHYARQAKGLLAGLFAAGFAVALLDSLIPVFIGRIATRRSPPMSATSFAGRAIGMWCASRGASSRTTSPAASPTG